MAFKTIFLDCTVNTAVRMVMMIANKMTIAKKDLVMMLRMLLTKALVAPPALRMTAPEPELVPFPGGLPASSATGETSWQK